MNKIKMAFRIYLFLIEMIKKLFKKDYEYERRKFIREGSLMYGCKYHYEDMIFRSLHQSVVLECPFHGIFVVDPASDHINSEYMTECPICTFHRHIYPVTHDWDEIQKMNKKQ